MTSHDNYFDRTIHAAATVFARWQGADAALEELTSSHKTLVIVARHETKAGSILRVCCIGPEAIAGPIRWSNACLAVSKVALSGSHGMGFLVSDAAAGLQITCESLEVKEMQANVSSPR